MTAKTPPMRVTLLKAEHGGSTISTPATGLLQIEETTPEGAITRATFRPKHSDGYASAVTLTGCEFIHLTADHKTSTTHLDPDTCFKGLDGPFDYWEDDFTALVHVLWSAKHQGLTLQGDADEVARTILHSRWLAASKARAAAQEGSGSAARPHDEVKG